MTDTRRAYSQREYFILTDVQNHPMDSVNSIFCPERKMFPILATCL